MMKKIITLVSIVLLCIQCTSNQQPENLDVVSETYDSGCKEWNQLQIDNKTFEYCLRNLTGYNHTEEVRFKYKTVNKNISQLDENELIAFYNKELKYFINNTDFTFSLDFYYRITSYLESTDFVYYLNGYNYSFETNEDYNIIYAEANYVPENNEIQIIMGYTYPL